jgi:hypothetical protein
LHEFRKPREILGPALVADRTGTGLTPEKEFAREYKKIDRSTDQLCNAVERIEQIQDNDGAIVMKRGLPTALADDLVKRLQEACYKLSYWGRINPNSADLSWNEVEVDLLEEEVEA